MRFAILLLLALILRVDTFGDPNLHGDENFYLTVGAAMHQGALPYVDVWDRKPLGLFLVYWLIAGISTAPIAYQLAATLCAAGTAWAIGEMARRWAKAQGCLLAGAVYLLWLAPLQGYGGQSPVFYNLLVALAALLVLNALPRLERGVVPRSVPLAMLLAGTAITVKTSAVFEAAFLGLLCASTLWRAVPRRAAGQAALWALIGAAPALLIAAAYWANGHWAEYWHAMVASNLAKPSDWATSWLRFRLMLVMLVPVLLVAAFGLIDHGHEARRLILAWLGAACLGLIAVPNFYPHYALPLLVPLCLAASAFLARGMAGRLAVAAIAVLSIWLEPPFRFDHTRQSIAAMDALVRTVKAHDAGRDLLTYEGPSQLYRLAGKRFVSPLVFPTHLSALIEKDVSHLSTLAEMRKALAAKPGVVVIADPIHNGPVNSETEALVRGYVAENCRFIGKRTILERAQTIDLAVWGDCSS